jgi:hypothetical protein
MMALPDFPRLPPPTASEPREDSESDETAASHEDTGADAAFGQEERASEQPGAPPPLEAANSYRFAGLVTLLPEDSASVDRRA